MSEETRLSRTKHIKKVEFYVSIRRTKIEILEEEIAAIWRTVPPELPEDREWRLAQMSPSERMLHDSAKTYAAANLDFLREEKWDGKISTKLEIRLPKDYKTIQDPEK